MNDNKKPPLDEALDAVEKVGDIGQIEYDEALKGLQNIIDEQKPNKRGAEAIHWLRYQTSRLTILPRRPDDVFADAAWVDADCSSDVWWVFFANWFDVSALVALLGAWTFESAFNVDRMFSLPIFMARKYYDKD